MSKWLFESTERQAVGARLEIVRNVLALGQGVFATRAGLKATAYNMYENGKRDLPVRAAIALCNTYELTLDWIYMGDPGNLPYKLAEAIKRVHETRVAAE